MKNTKSEGNAGVNIETKLIKMEQRSPRQRLLCMRCGQCCKDVHFQHHNGNAYSPQEIDQIKAAFNVTTEEKQIAEMLEYRGAWDVEWASRVIPIHHYSCKNLHQTESGEFYCSIYENRPSMCRSFPFDYELPGLKKKPENNEEKLIYLGEFPYISQYAGCSYNVDNGQPI